MKLLSYKGWAKYSMFIFRRNSWEVQTFLFFRKMKNRNLNLMSPVFFSKKWYQNVVWFPGPAQINNNVFVYASPPILFFKVKINENDSYQHTRFFFYKSILYKNIHDEIDRKVKNVLRMLSSWIFFCRPKISILSFLWVWNSPNLYPGGGVLRQVEGTGMCRP